MRQAVPVPEAHPFRARLSLFTGKGGVGKSTVVAALALEAAARGLRPLVVELGHRATLPALFADAEVGFEPRPVAPGVDACQVAFGPALEAYVRRRLTGPLARRVLQSGSVRRFFEAAPGTPEVLTLDRLATLVDAVDDTGAPRHHPVLVDFDATGHALMFLGLPKVFDGLISGGPLAALFVRGRALLAEPSTRLYIVTLPQRLPVQETLELEERLRRDHPSLHLGAVIVNRVRTAPLAPALREPFDRLYAARRKDPALRLLAEAMARHAGSQRELDRLEGPRVELPELPAGGLEPAALRRLGARCAAALEGV
jgi:arsenite-transporting ATPase